MRKEREASYNHQQLPYLVGFSFSEMQMAITYINMFMHVCSLPVGGGAQHISLVISVVCSITSCNNDTIIKANTIHKNTF